MFGFIFGVLCVVGLYHYLKHGSMWRRGCGMRGYRGFGRRMVLGRFFSRLDTSPGQERAIEGALSDLEDEWRKIRQGKRELREDLAAVMREETVDASRLEAALSKHQGAIAGMRSAGIAAFTRVHEILDPYQRRRLAELLVSGGRHGCGGGVA